MPTETLKNNITSLKKQYEESNRFKVFGNTLSSIEVSGVRGINNQISMSFDFPITAISGLNGAGKSTIAQLTICAFKAIKKENVRFYIKDFFPISKLDNPFNGEVHIKYTYKNDDTKKLQEVTISRQQDRWSGYKRQPEKNCSYIGLLVYLPKVERKDFTITTKHQNHTISSTTKIDERVLLEVAKIIGFPYENANFTQIKHNNSSTELLSVEKFQKSYSENHMGFGEGRIFYIVHLLENSDNKSFFVIEEPEIALHEEAQQRFIEYLIDVCKRKQHQIILSTHSSIITNTLPPEARKLIQKNSFTGECSIVNRVSSSQITAVLSQKVALIICVEDIFAKRLLTEVIREIDSSIIPMIFIQDFGDKNTVQVAVNVLQKANNKAIAVRDADVGQDKNKNLFSFPVIGNTGNPPEIDVFSNKKVIEFFSKKYSLNISWEFQKNQLDHHDYTHYIAEKIGQDEPSVCFQAIKEYLSDKDIVEKHEELIKCIQSILDNK